MKIEKQNEMLENCTKIGNNFNVYLLEFAIYRYSMVVNRGILLENSFLIYEPFFEIESEIFN